MKKTPTAPKEENYGTWAEAYRTWRGIWCNSTAASLHTNLYTESGGTVSLLFPLKSLCRFVSF
jgi:hypothetical protein